MASIKGTGVKPADLGAQLTSRRGGAHRRLRCVGGGGKRILDAPGRGLRARTGPGTRRGERALRGLRLHAVGAGLTEYGVDALDQLARAERLGDVVVGAHLEADLLVDVTALGREQDDGDVAGPVFRLQ